MAIKSFGGIIAMIAQYANDIPPNQSLIARLMGSNYLIGVKI